MPARFTSACLGSVLLIAAGWPALGQAWEITVRPGQRRLFLQVGVGSQYANNSTRNAVSVTVPIAQLGTGIAQRLNSNSPQSRSSLTNALVCDTSQQQVYVAAAYRGPPGNSGPAQLRVSTPAQLTAPNGQSIPISELQWTSSHLGGGIDIPSGSFTGGTQLLATLQPNRWIENCLTFYYRNTAMRQGATYTASAHFTLSTP